MVVELLLAVFVTVMRGFLMGMPTVPVPGWLDPSGPLGTLFAGTAAMSAWMPWTLLATVGGACVLMWVVGLGIKIVRIVASFVTLGGGSAA